MMRHLGAFASHLFWFSFQTKQFVLHFIPGAELTFSVLRALFNIVFLSFFIFVSYQKAIVSQNGMDLFVGLEEQWGKYQLCHALLIFMTSIIKVLNFFEMIDCNQTFILFFDV